jgi:hypothetical protein
MVEETLLKYGEFSTLLIDIRLIKDTERRDEWVDSE